MIIERIVPPSDPVFTLTLTRDELFALRRIACSPRTLAQTAIAGAMDGFPTDGPTSAAEIKDVLRRLWDATNAFLDSDWRRS